MIYYVDLFCGAGGVSTAIHQTENCKVVACVNHDQNAIESHRANYSEVKHFNEDVRDKRVVVEISKIITKIRAKDPSAVIALWASLECTNFSNAKGGKAKDADSRTLANCLFMYVRYLKPDTIWIENVREFMAWGDLDEKGKPISRDKGRLYEEWRDKMNSFGYSFDYRILNAADFGARQARVRFFGQFVINGMKFWWPEQSHTDTRKKNKQPGLSPWKPVSEILDFSDKGKSIFGRKKPLVENTLKRIYAGLVKYVAQGDDSFIHKYFSGNPDDHLVSLNKPLGTITTVDHHALVQSEFLIKYYGNSDASDITRPCPTLTTKDRLGLIYVENNPSERENSAVEDQEIVDSFIFNPQWGGSSRGVSEPIFTIIARMDKAPPYLIQIEKSSAYAIAVFKGDSETLIKIKKFMAYYGIVDIRMRMLKIEELLQGQGFPSDYVLRGNQAERKKYIGNAVEVNMGKALISAQAKRLTKRRRETMNVLLKSKTI